MLVACGGNSTVAPVSSGNSTTRPASGQQPPGVAPTQASGVVAPLTGADGQITVIAPPASGGNLPGVFTWVNGNNIWLGGANSQTPPITANSLGGKQITKASPLAQAVSPSLSPDGSQLVYAYSPEPEGSPGNIVIGQDIWLYDLKSNQSKMLIQRDEPQTFLDDPIWSADGKYIYFDYRTPSRDQKGVVVGEKIGIDRFEIATSNRERLLGDARYPAPMADGKSVVYVATDASGGTYDTDLRVLDLATKQSKALLNKNQNFIQYYVPRPSPGGDWIVFSAVGGPDTAVDPNAAVPVQPNPAPTPTKAAVTKDGPGLALLNSFAPSLLGSGMTKGVAAHGLPYDLWLIKPDGSNVHRLTTLFEDQPVPAWSKNGKQVTFLAGLGLYTIDVDGKNLVKRSDKGSHGGFDWRE